MIFFHPLLPSTTTVYSLSPGFGSFSPTHHLLLSSLPSGFGSAMIWLHIMPAMLFVKTKCRDKPVDGGLSNMVSLLYAVGISVGETAGSYIAGW